MAVEVLFHRDKLKDALTRGVGKFRSTSLITNKEIKRRRKSTPSIIL